jgi:hypothetical protein
MSVLLLPQVRPTHCTFLSLGKRLVIEEAVELEVDELVAEYGRRERLGGRTRAQEAQRRA